METVLIIASFIGFFLWNRSESRNDIRALQADINGVKGELTAFRQEMHKEFSSFRKEMHAEMRDFHGRLCTLEEKNYKAKNKEKS